MSARKCSRCKAELLPEVNFCRRCGAAVPPQGRASARLRTVIGADESPTRRLEPRPTSRRQVFADTVVSSLDSAAVSRQRRRLPYALLLVLLALFATGVICWVALFRPKSHETTATESKFAYPGAQIILDSTGDTGRAIQMQTRDSVDQVIAWYTTNLKPTKTVQVGSTTTVLKNQEVTATIVAGDTGTTILIKQTVP